MQTNDAADDNFAQKVVAQQATVSSASEDEDETLSYFASLAQDD
jgi:hypothetical protein